jgi:hypothetical protein
MALWQFDLLLVPHDAESPVLSDDGWVASPVSKVVAHHTSDWLQRRLGEPSHWMEDWMVYGSEKGNRVDLLTNEDGTGELHVRMDARAEAEDFSELACKLARIADCDIFGLEKGAFLEPAPRALRQEMANSKAGAYVQNPREYIRRVADEG